MKKWILLLILALIGVFSWYFLVTKKKPKDETPKQEPLSVSQYSDSLNLSFNKLLTSYYALTNDFVNWDSSSVSKRAVELKADLQNLNLNEVRKDSIIHQTALTFIESSKGEVEGMIAGANLVQKRRALNNLSDNMYNLMRTIRYDGGKIYLQECPMAFNETEPGVWLSSSDSIQNPYLGLHHPKYKSGMLECGATKDTLNFTTR
ncbi:MAG TPA: DUF3347 domain-containing protein [Chitinophagaceae bacterium]|jgi:hypothetical protein|nr:DUF3347 domain-containing protein [Chitinophagaceae bacterium]